MHLASGGHGLIQQVAGSAEAVETELPLDVIYST